MRVQAKKLVIILMIFVLVIGIVVQAVMMAGYAEIKDKTDYSVTRVNLSTVQKEADGSVYVTVKGQYKINNGAVSVPYGTKVNLKKSGTNIIMSWGANSVNMGSTVDFVKEDTTNEGLQILNSAKGTLINYLGNIKVSIDSGGALYFLNTINLETYLMGVVPYEMSDSFPIEALKAQAVGARTVAARYNARNGVIIDTESAQVYFGYNPSHTNAKAAIEATKGQVLKFNGSLIEVFYSQSNGGQTSQVTCAWPSGTDLPYYAIVDDPADLKSNPPTTTIKLPKTVNSTYTLDSTVSAILRAEIKSKLASEGTNVDANGIEILNVNSVNIHTPKCSGHVCNRYLYAGMNLKIRLSNATGKVIIGELKSGTGSLNIRDGQGTSYKLLGAIPEGATFTILDMSGSWYKVEYNGIVGYSSPNFIQVKEEISTGEREEPGKELEREISIDVLMSKFNSKKTKTLTEDSNYFYIQCRGSHGIGMSQYGARQRAKDGAKYTDIIAFYYLGAYLEEVNTGEAIVETPPIDSYEPIAKGTAMVDDFLNIRQGPGSSYNSLGKMLPGDVCDIIELPNQSWAKIVFGDIVGYASTMYLKIEPIASPSQSADPTPSLSPSPSPSPSPSKETPTPSTSTPTPSPSPSPSKETPTPSTSTPTPSPSPSPSPSKETPAPSTSTPSPSPSPSKATPSPSPVKPSPSPSKAQPSPSAATTYTAKLKAGTGGLNVRSGAGTSYTKLTTIPEGETFTVLDKSGSWYKVNYKGIVGYASSNYITITGSAGTATPSPSPSKAQPSPSAATNYTAKLKAGTGGLNVRSGAGTSYTKLTTIPEGVTFTVLDKSGSWYKVNYKGIVGYASSNYITITGSAGTATPSPSPSTAPSQKPEDSSGTTYTAKLKAGTGGLNVRSGAGTSYTKLTTIPEGVTFTVLDKSGSWYKVNYKGIVGYASSNYINIVTNAPSAPSTGGNQTSGGEKDDTSTYTAKLVSGTGSLRIRDGAGVSANTIGYINEGETFTVLDKGSNGWYRVSNGKVTGYSSSEYIEIIDGSSEKFGSVNVDPGSVLNIRSGASTEYTVIGSIPAKGKVVILQDLGNWLKISYNGTIGYVSAEFIIE